MAVRAERITETLYISPEPGYQAVIDQTVIKAKRTVTVITIK